MTKQYTNSKDVEKYLKNKIIKETGNKQILKNIEFVVSNAKDENGQDYIYVHTKDYGDDYHNFSVACYYAKKIIQDNCSNLIEVISADNMSRKQLLWLPKDKDCLALYESGEKYSSIINKKINLRK